MSGEAQTWRTLQFSRGSNSGSLKSLKLKSRTWQYYKTHMVSETRINKQSIEILYTEAHRRLWHRQKGTRGYLYPAEYLNTLQT
jgi:hypothetical protein